MRFPKLPRWFPFWAVALVIFFASGTIWLRLYVVKTSYSIDQIEKSLVNVRKEKESIELEIAKLKSPSRLKKLAQKKFKLAPPTPGQTVHLDRGQ